MKTEISRCFFLLVRQWHVAHFREKTNIFCRCQQLLRFCQNKRNTWCHLRSIRNIRSFWALLPSSTVPVLAPLLLGAKLAKNITNVLSNQVINQIWSWWGRWGKVLQSKWLHNGEEEFQPGKDLQPGKAQLDGVTG